MYNDTVMCLDSSMYNDIVMCLDSSMYMTPPCVLTVLYIMTLSCVLTVLCILTLSCVLTVLCIVTLSCVLTVLCIVTPSCVLKVVDFTLSDRDTVTYFTEISINRYVFQWTVFISNPSLQLLCSAFHVRLACQEDVSHDIQLDRK